MTDAVVSSMAKPRSFKQATRRTKRLTTALLCLFLAYTFFPLFYLLVASTKSNFDLFSTFGLWFGHDFSLFANLSDLFAHSNGIFSRWLFNTFLYSLIGRAGRRALCNSRRVCVRQILLRRSREFSSARSSSR